MQADPQQFIDDVTEFIGASRIDLAQSRVAASRINPRERSARDPVLAARVRRLREALERRRMYRTITRLGFLFRYCFGRGEPFSGIQPETERTLRDYFRPDIEALEKLAERDLSPWKK